MWQNFKTLTFDQLFQNLSQLDIDTWIFTTLFDHLTHNFTKDFMLLESEVSLKTRVLHSLPLKKKIYPRNLTIASLIVVPCELLKA